MKKISRPVIYLKLQKKLQNPYAEWYNVYKYVIDLNISGVYARLFIIAKESFVLSMSPTNQNLAVKNKKKSV